MQKNPYISLLNLMEQVSRSSNSPDIQIGQILASPPDIKVRYNGIILTKEELWISHYLLAGYGRTAKGHLVSATQNRAGGSGDAVMRLTSPIIMISIMTTPIPSSIRIH